MTYVETNHQEAVDALDRSLVGGNPNVEVAVRSFMDHPVVADKITDALSKDFANAGTAKQKTATK